MTRATASTAPLSTVPDNVLAGMVTRAWRESARCWSEYRAEPNGSPIKAFLLTSAEAAEAYWSDLIAEQERRIDLIVEDASRTDVPSTDQRAFVTEPSRVTRPAIRVVPTESPWVKRAAAKRLPAKDLTDRVTR